MLPGGGRLLSPSVARELPTGLLLFRELVALNLFQVPGHTLHILHTYREPFLIFH